MAFACSTGTSASGDSVELNAWTGTGNYLDPETEQARDFVGSQAAAATPQNAAGGSTSTVPSLTPEQQVERDLRDFGWGLSCLTEVRLDCEPDAAQPVQSESAPVVFPAVSEHDLTTITPAPGELILEPDGAGLVRRNFNVVVNATSHTRQGEILGFPVTVRFTPVNYTFDYGDGTVVDSDTGGITQASENAPQFTKTPTSHVYLERGEYTITVTTHYSAAVDFGDGVWREVAGTIQGSASADVRMYEAHTVLVAENCIDNPNGTGC